MGKPQIFQLQTMPCAYLTEPLEFETPVRYSGMKRFRKEIVRCGKFVQAATGEKINISLEMLEHWADTFKEWVEKGHRVFVPPGHVNRDDPTKNQGWVTAMEVVDNSLYAVMELIDPALAQLTEVSIYSDPIKIDGEGNRFEHVITHVALTNRPVVGGLKDFEVLSLSLIDGEHSMKLLESMRAFFNLPTDATEDVVMAKAVEQKKPAEKVALSLIPTKPVMVDPLAKLVSDNRAMKLSQLVKVGLITPAVNTLLTERYVKAEAVALELSKGVDDGFDILYDVLVQNRPVKLDELTGVQSLELTNPSVEQPNAMNKEVARRRTEAGLDK